MNITVKNKKELKEMRFDLRHKGFKRHTIEDCPDCYSIEDFCQDHPKGVFVIGTGTHAVAIIDGCYYDAWQSGREPVVYYFEKEK